MPRNGNFDIDLTLKAWADIVLNKWLAGIVNIPVIDSGALRDSLKYTLLINSGNSIDKIEFSFKLYGIFVSQLYRKGMVKDAESAEDWFSKKYFAQVMRLKEILAEKYQMQIVFSMTEIISAPLTSGQRSIEIKY